MIDITRAMEVAYECSASQRSLRRTRFMKRRKERVQVQSNNGTEDQQAMRITEPICNVLRSMGFATTYQSAQVPQLRERCSFPTNVLCNIRQKHMSDFSTRKEISHEGMDLAGIVQKMQCFIDSMPRSNFSASVPGESTQLDFVLFNH